MSPLHSGYSIVIADHGHGMSREDVVNKWMVPSTQDKHMPRRKSPSGRTMQGSKGVGRYAASILGTDLLLETVNGAGEKTTAHFVWKDFESAEYLDDVPIRVETAEVSEPPGTRLTINGDDEFLAGWDQKGFEKLQFELKKLKSPVSTVFGDDEFHINLKVTGFPGVVDIDEVVDPIYYLISTTTELQVKSAPMAKVKSHIHRRKPATSPTST